MSDTQARLATSLRDRYRIERELGQGGMATVYLAEDLKHARHVAIKVLHPELSAVIGGERFLSEIKTTASLQHPHILGLIDSGEADGLLYYVMPFVEGESLRGRLSREKQLPVEDAVRLAREVASALEFAHKRGIVHRDIKPENILLQDGQALVADFGIALAVQQAGGHRLTQTGMSLGTPAYMSPEQAMGEREIGPRSDVYALGTMTYEMLTGEPPFTGPNSQAIVAKVLTEQPPPLRPRRPLVPIAVEEAVLAALQKLPADRWGSAREFAEALANGRAAGRPDGRMAAAVTASSRLAVGPWRRAVVPALVLLSAVSVLAAIRAHAGRSTSDAPVRRYQMSFGNTRWEGAAGRGGLALSPDGARIAFLGPSDDERMLWLRSRDALTAQPLAGTEAAVQPFFSPDGTQLGFFSAQNRPTILTMSLAGAAPVLLTDSAVGLDGATWADDGYVYYDGLTAGGTRGLMRVSASGGAPEQFTTVDTAAGETDHIRPAALPGARALLFTLVSRDPARPAQIVALDLESRSMHRLVPGVTGLFLAPDRLVVRDNAGKLLAVPFDVGKLEVTGDPIVVADGGAAGPLASLSFAVDAHGTLAYVTERGMGTNLEVVRVTPTGQAATLEPAWTGGFHSLGLSPDGSRLAAAMVEGIETHVWVRDLAGGLPSRLTQEGSPNFGPSWTGDGTQVLYVSFANSLGILARRRADGGGDREVVVRGSPFAVSEGETSRDGRWVLVRNSTQQLIVMPAGQDTARPSAAIASGMGRLALSPDGRWVAYAGGESGRTEVYVRPFPNTADGKWTVSRNGGGAPRWGHDGRALYFVAGDSLYATEVPSGARRTFGAPRALFSMAPYLRVQRTWDVLPNGDFLMIRRAGTERDAELVVTERLDRQLHGTKTVR